MTRSTDQIFSSAGLSARDQVVEWVNVKKTVGDYVAGEFLGYWETPAHGDFKDQLSVAILLKEGKGSTKSTPGIEHLVGNVVAVNLNDSAYMRPKVTQSQVGDGIGIRFEGEKDTGKIQKAKIIKYYNPDLEDRKRAGTVKTSQPEVGSTTEAGDGDAPSDDDLDF